MDSVDLRRLEDAVEEVCGWAGIGLSPMHLSIKLSHVILMNMKYKSQPSSEKLRERALGRRCVEVERKWQWLLRDWKFGCFFLFVCLFGFGFAVQLEQKCSNWTAKWFIKCYLSFIVNEWVVWLLQSEVSNTYRFLPFVPAAKWQDKEIHLVTFFKTSISSFLLRQTVSALPSGLAWTPVSFLCFYTVITGCPPPPRHQ